MGPWPFEVALHWQIPVLQVRDPEYGNTEYWPWLSDACPYELIFSSILEVAELAQGQLKRGKAIA